MNFCTLMAVFEYWFSRFLRRREHPADESLVVFTSFLDLDIIHVDITQNDLPLLIKKKEENIMSSFIATSQCKMMPIPELSIIFSQVKSIIIKLAYKHRSHRENEECVNWMQRDVEVYQIYTLHHISLTLPFL